MRALGYRATKEEDGTLIVHRVPIFVECERGDHAFDEEWLEAAFDKAKLQQREGYLPPLHIRHHEPGVEPRAAGWFRITSLAQITYQGEKRLALFADLHITDESAQREVLAKRLPYRSVEIFDVDAPAIDSLALLDHESPYFELPMLMVSEIERVSGDTIESAWHLETHTTGMPLVASLRRGRRELLLFRHEDPPMAKKTAKKPAADNGKSAQFASDDGEEKPPQPGGDDGGDKGGDGDGEGEEQGDGEDLADQAHDVDVAAVIAAIESGSISVADMEAIIAAIQAKTPPEQAAPNPGAQPAPPAPPGQAMKQQDDTGKDGKAATGKADNGSGLSERFAKIEGENVALKARLDAREAEDRRRTDVAEAMKRLHGRPLGADLEQKLVAFHTDHGGAAFKAYVDSMVATFAEIAGGDDPAAAAMLGQAPKTSAVAMNYAQHGTDAAEKAARFAREWQDLHERGLVRMSEERYVAVNMAKLGVQLKKTA